jgi:hypothetical protein
LHEAKTISPLTAVIHFTRVLLPIIAALTAGCALFHDPSYDPIVTYSQKEIFDIVEVSLRHRLATRPLPRHSRCYVFIEKTDVAIDSFAGRFPEYRMIVKRNSPGNSQPARSYFVRIGRTTRDDAWVVLRDASGSMGYHLRRKEGRWEVIFAERPVLT